MEDLFNAFDEVNGQPEGTTEKVWLNDPHTIEFLKDLLTRLNVSFGIITDPEKLAGLVYGKLSAEAAAFDNYMRENDLSMFNPDEFDAYQSDPMYTFQKDQHIDKYLEGHGVHGYCDPDHVNHFNFKSLLDVGKKAFSVIKKATAKQQDTNAAQANVAQAQQQLVQQQAGVVTPPAATNGGAGLDDYVNQVNQALVANKTSTTPTVVSQLDGIKAALPYIIIAIIVAVLIARKMK